MFLTSELVHDIIQPIKIRILVYNRFARVMKINPLSINRSHSDIFTRAFKKNRLSDLVNRFNLP